LVIQVNPEIGQVSNPGQPNLALFHRGFGAQSGLCPGYSITLFRRALRFQLQILARSHGA
jgi:hypothetical protein